MSDFNQYLDLSQYPPFSPPLSPEEMSRYLYQLPPLNTYPFPTIGSTLDTAMGMNANGPDFGSYTGMQQPDPSLADRDGSTLGTDATDTGTNAPDLSTFLQQPDQSLAEGNTFNTDAPDLYTYLQQNDPDFLDALSKEWEEAEREAERVRLAGCEETTGQAEAGPQTDMDMDTREGTNDDTNTVNDVDMDVDDTNAGVGFELTFTEFNQLLSPLDYNAAGSGSGGGSDSTCSSPLSEVPSTPPTSYDPSPSTSAPSSSHALQASSRKGRTSQVPAQPLVTRAGSRLKPFGGDAADEMDQDRHHLWGQKSTVLIGKAYALKACRRIPLDEMVQPAYVARNSDPLDAWHAGRNYYPVPSAPELALVKRAPGSGSGAQFSQSGPRRAPCFVTFESENQFGPGVALIEALNDRDVASSNSWPAFDFSGARSGEIVPFWPGYGEGQRVQIRRGMRLGEVARLIAQEFHTCWKRWGTVTVSPKEHLGFRIADSRHTRRTTAIDFSQVRLRGLFSLGSGQPYYAQLVVKIP